MKVFKSIIILVIFFKTGNVLSQNDLFNVNNIEILNTSTKNNEEIANQAIKIGYIKLIERLLLIEDTENLKKIEFKTIKNLVSYYQIVQDENESKKNLKIFNIFFDKEKLHNLFFEMGISYSDIAQDEFYILPILKTKDQIYVYSQNYFYENWNNKSNNELMEFILPLENIETIQKINSYYDNILDLDLREIFLEYEKKNLALILIEERSDLEKKIFLKTIINSKKINKNLTFKKSSLNKNEFNNKIINEISREIINIAKSQNLIDVRVPSFINIQLKLNKKNNLVELNNRINNVDLIENIFVQEFNNQYVFLKIKYLGKIDKLIEELENQKIILKMKGDIWSLKII